MKEKSNAKPKAKSVLAESQPQSMPALSEVAQAMTRLDNAYEPTETHGILCAFLCSGAKLRGEAWVSSLVGENIAVKDDSFHAAKQCLRTVFQITHDSLVSGEFDFQLLLPGDDEDLFIRIEEFAKWCQGFVSGLNLAGISLKSQEVGPLQEAIDDLVKFSCLQYDEEDPLDEANEKAYQELLEYARVAVMLIYTERDQLVHNRAGTMKGNHTLH